MSHITINVSSAQHAALLRQAKAWCASANQHERELEVRVRHPLLHHAADGAATAASFARALHHMQRAATGGIDSITMQAEDSLDVSLPCGLRFTLTDPVGMRDLLRLRPPDGTCSAVRKRPHHGPDARVALSDWHMDWALREEVPVAVDVSNKDQLMSAVRSGQPMLGWRLKRRYSARLQGPAGTVWRADATVVKQALGAAGSDAAQALRAAQETFEVEVELLEQQDLKTSLYDERAERIVADGIHLAYGLVAAIEGGYSRLTPAAEQRGALAQYLQQVVGAPDGRTRTLDAARARARANFAGPRAVALQREQLGVVIDSDAYTVTDKADGERHLLYCCRSSANGKSSASKPAAYVIDDRLGVHATGMVVPDDSAGLLLDGELLLGLHPPTFLVFDAYFGAGGVWLGHLGHAERLAQAMAVLGTCAKDDMCGITVRFKTFRPSGAPGACRDALADALAAPYGTDGLIFTPTGPVDTSDAAVPQHAAQRMRDLATFGRRTFKWKAPEDATVDFALRLDPANGDMQLLVGATDPVDPWSILKRRASAVAVPPGRAEAFASKPAYRARAFATWSAPDMPCSASETKEPLQPMTVVECAWRPDLDRWDAVRVRHDKTAAFRERYARAVARKRSEADALDEAVCGTANDIEVARHTLRVARDAPLTAQDLVEAAKFTQQSLERPVDDAYYRLAVVTDGSSASATSSSTALKPLRTAHGIIKQRILRAAATYAARELSGGRPHLLDIGVGKAGDLHKWAGAGYRRVVGVDAVADNLLHAHNGAYRRLETAGDPGLPSCLFLVLDACRPWWVTGTAEPQLPSEPTQRHLLELARDGKLPPAFKNAAWAKAWQGALRPGAFDVVSCQFMLHYAFGDADSLDALCSNAAQALGTKQRGCFIATCFDGCAVRQALAAVPKGKCIRGPDWMIRKMYDENVDDPFGQNIGHYIASIGAEIMEPLVDFSVLRDCMARHGLFPLSLGPAGLGLIAEERHEASFVELVDAGMAQLSPALRQYSSLNPPPAVPKEPATAKADSDQSQPPVRAAAPLLAAQVAQQKQQQQREQQQLQASHQHLELGLADRMWIRRRDALRLAVTSAVMLLALTAHSMIERGIAAYLTSMGGLVTESGEMWLRAAIVAAVFVLMWALRAATATVPM